MTPGVCDHKCVNTEGSYQCSCYDGYTVDPGNPSQCRVREGSVSLLFSNGSDFSIVDTDTKQVTQIINYNNSWYHILLKPQTRLPVNSEPSQNILP